MYYKTNALLKEYQDKKGWSMAELGRRMNVTRQTVSLWKLKGLPDERLADVISILKIPRKKITESLLKDRENQIKELLRSA